MKNYNSQIILYAKGWFETSDTIEDLKKLVGKRQMMEPEHISEENIIIILLNIIEKHQDFSNPMRFFSKFLDNISPNSIQYRMFGSEETWNFNKAIIKECLSTICILKCYDESKGVIIELDDPDYSILPKSES